jgi:hypothetical protein
MYAWPPIDSGRCALGGNTVAFWGILPRTEADAHKPPLPRPARRRFCRLGPPGRVRSSAYHLRAYGAVVHESHHCCHHPRPAGHDHQRNVPELPRPRSASAGGQLGCVAATGAERADCGHLALAHDPPISVIIAVLTFNFLGDGLRDAADPMGTKADNVRLFNGSASHSIHNAS